ncbi:hypothetical protein AVEN_106106-1 [Araneus ventricosus]|uniref:Uncharacterized protein n=1 Tax=Araneus ventricosus TaxID=182803 RepID=A0A4Y2SYB4_ARAVE|nr:hypothetical protein AVEN_106106-1 [Araneus ventricosus]
MGYLYVNSHLGVKRHPLGVVRKFGEVVPAQVSPLLSARGSKLRGPSQNRPRVTSKGDANITKLNYDDLPKAARPRWPSGKVSTSGPEDRRFETRFH